MTSNAIQWIAGTVITASAAILLLGGDEPTVPPTHGTIAGESSGIAGSRAGSSHVAPAMPHEDNTTAGASAGEAHSDDRIDEYTALGNSIFGAAPDALPTRSNRARTVATRSQPDRNGSGQGSTWSGSFDSPGSSSSVRPGGGIVNGARNRSTPGNASDVRSGSNWSGADTKNIDSFSTRNAPDDRDWGGTNTGPAFNFDYTGSTSDPANEPWSNRGCPAALPQGSTAADAQAMQASYGCRYLEVCRPLNQGNDAAFCWWSYYRGG